MKITYDKEANAVYIYMDKKNHKMVYKTYSCDPMEVNGMINLDFDEDGKLLGIEIMDADKKLPESILRCAKRLDEN